MPMTTQYDPSNPNHKVTCTRTKCSGLDQHPAGRHLDQRDELYDGPEFALGAASIYIRDSARKIISEAPSLMPEVMDLVNYVAFMQDQVAHLRVDRDRGISDAMARSESCENHGKEIRQLTEQVHHFDESQRRADAGRVALLELLHGLDEAVESAKRNPELVTKANPVDFMKSIERMAKSAHAAHNRALSHYYVRQH